MTRLLPLLLLPCLLVVSVAEAGAPGEARFIAPSEIPDSILVQTIAIASMRQEAGTVSPVPMFAQTDSGFCQTGYLNLAGCLPFSRFGYRHRGEDRSNMSCAARFPVVEASGGFIRIVTNPHINSSAWVERPAEGGSWRYGIVWVDSISSKEVRLDVFFLASADSVTVYDGPDGMPCGLLRKRHLPGVLQAVEQRGDFIRIVALIYTWGGVCQREDPVGWIRVRDAEGKLIVWQYDFSF